MLVGTWLALNPLVFGEPCDHRAWAARAMLGEELWITRRPHDAAIVVSAATSFVAAVGVVAARRRQLRPTAIAVAAQMGLTMVYWQQMVRYFERQERVPNAHQ